MTHVNVADVQDDVENGGTIKSHTNLYQDESIIWPVFV